jgi:hypothetical protein
LCAASRSISSARDLSIFVGLTPIPEDG